MAVFQLFQYLCLCQPWEPKPSPFTLLHVVIMSPPSSFPAFNEIDTDIDAILSVK